MAITEVELSNLIQIYKCSVEKLLSLSRNVLDPRNRRGVCHSIDIVLTLFVLAILRDQNDFLRVRDQNDFLRVVVFWFAYDFAYTVDRFVVLNPSPMKFVWYERSVA